jgi:hypothetical protein
LPEFRRVFEELLAGTDSVDAVLRLIEPMQDGLPMGLFHPLIRVSFATLHGDRGLIADALAYMAIRYFDLYRTPIPTQGLAERSRSAASVWKDLPANITVEALLPSARGGSIRICEELCASAPLHSAALPVDFDVPAICAQALRLYSVEPSLTTLHAVTSAQALADLTRRASAASAGVLAGLWTRYWIWLTALYIEKGRTELPTAATEAPAESWSELSARARAIPEVHLIKMAYSCRWLDEAFGPEPLYKAAVANMIDAKRRAA